MLRQLRIVNFAIIKELELELHEGLNILSGETGAGKSIIVGAASMLRGGRSSGAMVRSGAQCSEIEALFDVSRLPQVGAHLDELGIDHTGDELLARRVIPRSGKGRVYINGSLCTLNMLSRATASLLDIAGQHEHQSLTQRSAQLQILDALGENDELIAEMRRRFDALSEAGRSLRAQNIDQRERAERIDFIRFQLAELETAQLEPGEDETLQRRCRQLRQASELHAAASNAERLLYSADGAVAEQLAGLQQELDGLSSADEALGPLARQIEEARLSIEDVALSLRRYAESIDLHDDALEDAEERLDLILRLKRKHGLSLEEILALVDHLREELGELESHDERLAERQAEFERARERAARVAHRLTKSRERAARCLSKEATLHMQGLCMEGAKLAVVVSPRAPRSDDPAEAIFDDRRMGGLGWDQVDLMISTNPGEAARPLGHIASGGELSRVMLALRQVIGKYDPLATSIYDEVDAGIGGRAADLVGRCLHQVSQHRQVLCVTHLPQVAAYAARHFHVGKGRVVGKGQRGSKRTVAMVERLSPSERVEELARMLGGSKITTRARANARELLAAVEEYFLSTRI